MVEPSILANKESDELHFQADNGIKKAFAADGSIFFPLLLVL